MSDPFADRDVPRGALLGAAALIGITIFAAAAARIGGVSATAQPAATPVVAIDVRFEDRADGAVVVRSPQDDRIVLVLEPGTNGFIRGVLRGLARERSLERIDAAPPFRLTRWDDGRLTLDDPATGRHVELEAFGPANAGAFAVVLDAAVSRDR
jgi:putative photosynthetic complex assembly protein